MSTDKHIEKTWEIREQELRAEISKQIEDFCRTDTWDHKLCFCMVCAEIVRGEHHD